MGEAALRLVDETSSGKVLSEVILRLVSERITIRELIERRVRQEVEEFRKRPTEVFRGLVQPTGAEKVLNGFKVKKARVIDADDQVSKALEAFGRNGFLLLVGDRQVEGLDDEIVVTEGLKVSFVKLVPLVGG